MPEINGKDQVILIDSIDVSDETVSAVFGPGTKQTYADMRGLLPSVLNMEITQNTDLGSLWSIATDAAEQGATVPVLWKPHGNAVASAAMPHFSATATISGPTGDAFAGVAAAEDGDQAGTITVAWKISDWLRVTV